MRMPGIASSNCPHSRNPGKDTLKTGEYAASSRESWIYSGYGWGGKSVRSTGQQSLLPVCIFLIKAICRSRNLAGEVRANPVHWRFRVLRIAYPLTINGRDSIYPFNCPQFIRD
jgi:hypothetical protein